MRLVLKLDRGLSAWLKAYAKGVGIYGGVEETAIALIRDGLIKAHGSDVFTAAMLPHLPKDIRKAVEKQPRLVREKQRLHR